MAFNLYFAGSQCKEADELMVKLNCNRLFSQENDRKNISNWQNYKHSRRTQYKGNIFIDSGAFSVHTKGIELDVDEYIEYINSIDKDIHIFAQVDKIPGEFGKQKTKEQILEAPALSWKNYLYMKDRVNSRDKLLPMATGSNDVLVVVQGEHSCMTARGIKSRGAKTRTATIRGEFNDNVELRKEAYSLMNLN